MDIQAANDPEEPHMPSANTKPIRPAGPAGAVPQRRGADRERVAEVMAEVAAGESAAIFELHAEFAPSIEAAVRRALRDFGVDHPEPDEVAGLVVEATLALGDSAGAWRPDGALPWWWAFKRIQQVVNRSLGQFAVSYDTDLHSHLTEASPPAWTGEEPSMLALVEDLAEVHEEVALLREAFAAMPGSERDRELLLVYTSQQMSGDQSPAETVAPMFAMTPAAVRQAVKRARDRLRVMAETDPRFSGMLEFALVA
jgi:hypothetical protein